MRVVVETESWERVRGNPACGEGAKEIEEREIKRM